MKITLEKKKKGLFRLSQHINEESGKKEMMFIDDSESLKFRERQRERDRF